jgi:hypothetical protein
LPISNAAAVKYSLARDRAETKSNRTPVVFQLHGRREHFSAALPGFP